MTTEELLDAIKDGKAHIDWGHVTSEHNGHKLRIAVMADAIRFDNVPPMNWHREPRPARAGERASYDGVRLPVTANEMQQVADLLGSLMLTPKVLDLIWQQAKRKFDPVINVNGQIVAMSDIHVVHEAIEKKIAAAGGDPGSLVASVGKFWVLSNRLVTTPKFGVQTACNYGWHSSGGQYPAVTKGLKVWQAEGTQHNDLHMDPSQVIRLMYQWAWLLRSGSSTWEQVNLKDIAADADLCGLINHDGILKVVRQPSVPEPQPVRQADGSYLMPEVYILGDPSPQPQDLV